MASALRPAQLSPGLSLLHGSPLFRDELPGEAVSRRRRAVAPVTQRGSDPGPRLRGGSASSVVALPEEPRARVASEGVRPDREASAGLSVLCGEEDASVTLGPVPERVLDPGLQPRGVAQSGSARALGARRRGFKSRLPDKHQNFLGKNGTDAKDGGFVAHQLPRASQGGTARYRASLSMAARRSAVVAWASRWVICLSFAPTMRRSSHPGCLRPLP